MSTRPVAAASHTLAHQWQRVYRYRSVIDPTFALASFMGLTEVELRALLTGCRGQKPTVAERPGPRHSARHSISSGAWSPADALRARRADRVGERSIARGSRDAYRRSCRSTGRGAEVTPLGSAAANLPHPDRALALAAAYR